MSKLFPAGIALGDAFYDRETERKALIAAIEGTRHTVLIAPRRFGKTSLMKKVMEEKKYPFLWLDFMTFTSRTEAEAKFLEHIADLVVSLASSESKLRALVKKYLLFLQPEITLHASSLLSIKFGAKTLKGESLVQALLAVDAMAADLNKQAVIICDEFQEIIQIDEGRALQGSIRHAAERAKHTTYLFSGSKHQALRRLFNGKQNPLYELCDQMSLSLIDRDYYLKYLGKESKLKWGQALSLEVLTEILNLTECYPRYVNAVCARIWRHEKLPDINLVQAIWTDYLYTRKAGIREELDALSMNERRLLKVLSAKATSQPFSKAFLSTADLSQSTLKRALENLQNKDLVCFFDEQYCVPDPTYKHYFELFG